MSFDCLRVLLVVLVVLCFQCGGPGARAIDIASPELQSCSHVAETFGLLVENGRESVLSRRSIFEEFQQGPGPAQNQVCDLERTCCANTAEMIFKNAATQSYQQQVQNMLAEILLPCHNHNFSSEMVGYIRQSRANLVDVLQMVFSFYFTPYVHIFDDFYEYLEQSILTGNLCEIEERYTEVFFEVYFSAVEATSVAYGFGEIPDSENFRSCLLDYFLETSSETLNNRLTGFLHSYNILMRYIRALRLMDVVIEGILELPLTRQCQDALVKMTYCSQCAGYSADLLPCQGLCHNSLRGCLVDISDLVEPIREFTEALVSTRRVLEYVRNPWDQITLLNSYFAAIVTGTTIDEITMPLSRCLGRKKRGAIDGVGSPRLHMVTKRSVSTPSINRLNHSSYCLGGTVSKLISLPETICVNANTSERNVDCWTGARLGSYERSVIDFERTAQKDNPELMICSKRSHFQTQINLLSSITRELNIITEQPHCSADDEDCIASVPHTCNYFNFNDLLLVTDDLTHEGSGSGSMSGSGGSGSGRPPTDMEDTDDNDACNRNGTLNIDFCSTNNGGCQHKCVSFGNSYRCECNSGYRLQRDGISCKALCKRNFTSKNYGIVKTPNWPESYPENVTCEWYIEVPNENKVVEITCDSTPYGIGGNYPLCKDDHLTIYDGHSEQDDRFGPYCRFRRPRAVKTSTNRAKVVFISGPSHRPTRKGFKCIFRSVDRPRRFTTTKVQLLRWTGSFQTPNWPRTYPTHVNYEWKIVLPNRNKRIQLTFERPFGIEGFLPGCHRDYLTITDDATGQVFGRYCQFSPPERIVMSSNVATVVFHSGPQHRPSRRGFKARYTSVD